MVELEGKNKALETENAQLRQRLKNTQILQVLKHDWCTRLIELTCMDRTKSTD